MYSKVIVHAKYKSLLEFKEKQEILHFEGSNDPINNELIFYKIEDEVLKLEMSDIEMDIYHCEFIERQSYDRAFFKGENIPYVDIVHSFRAYVCPIQKTIFLNTNTDEGKKFIKKYNLLLKKHDTPLIETYKVNFEHVETRALEVKGSWFSKDGGLVTSQGLMGNQIEKSIEFTGLKKTSKVSSLTISIFVAELNTTLSVIVSGKGSLYIQNKIPVGYNTIDLLWILFNILIID